MGVMNILFYLYNALSSQLTIGLVFADYVGRTRNSYIGALYSRVFISVKRIWVSRIEHKSRMNNEVNMILK